jgi:hypothetical protein
MGLLFNWERKKGFFPPKRMMCLKRSSVYLMTGPEKQSPTEGYGNQNTEGKAASSL